jgi:hypothetical protein
MSRVLCALLTGCVASIIASDAAAQNSLKEKLSRLRDATVFVQGRLGTSSGFVIKRQADLAVIVATQEGQAVVFYAGTVNERIMSPTVLYWDRDTRRCLMVVKGKDLPEALPYDISRELEETAEITIVGFPLGVALATDRLAPRPTFTKGSVSKTIRERKERIIGYQVDADVNGGCAGAPVIDDEGQLVGIAAGKLDRTIIGFVDSLRKFDQLLRGTVEREVTMEQVAATDKDVTFRFKGQHFDWEGKNSIELHVMDSSRIRQIVRADEEGVYPPLHKDALIVPAKTSGRAFSGTLTWPREKDRTQVPVLYQVVIVLPDKTKVYGPPERLTLELHKARVGKVVLSDTTLDLQRNYVEGLAAVPKPMSKLTVESTAARKQDGPKASVHRLALAGRNDFAPLVAFSADGRRVIVGRSERDYWQLDVYGLPELNRLGGARIKGGHVTRIVGTAAGLFLVSDSCLLLDDETLEPKQEIGLKTETMIIAPDGLRIYAPQVSPHPTAGSIPGLVVFDVVKNERAFAYSANMLRLADGSPGPRISEIPQAAVIPGTQSLLVPGDGFFKIDFGAGELVITRESRGLAGDMRPPIVSPDGKWVARTAARLHGREKVFAQVIEVFDVKDLTFPQTSFALRGSTGLELWAFDASGQRVFACSRDYSLDVLSVSGRREQSVALEGYKVVNDNDFKLLPSPRAGGVCVATMEFLYYVEVEAQRTPK